MAVSFLTWPDLETRISLYLPTYVHTNTWYVVWKSPSTMPRYSTTMSNISNVTFIYNFLFGACILSLGSYLVHIFFFRAHNFILSPISYLDHRSLYNNACFSLI